MQSGCYDVFEDVLGGLFGNLTSGSKQYPDDNGLIIEIDVPGSTKDDVTLEFKDGILGVKVNRKRNGVVVDAYNSIFRLKEGVHDFEKISASVENGVLSIRIERVPEAQPKKIIVS